MTLASEERELRHSIRLLDSILAQVLEKQDDVRVAAAVRVLRRDFTQLTRHDSATKMRQLFKAIEPLPPDTLSAVVRAFNLYFSLLNIAEETHGLVLRRRLAEQGGHFWNGSFHDTLLILKDAGVDVRQMQTLLDELLYMPVITAHPTEAKRRTVKNVLRNIFLAQERLEDTRLRGYSRQQMLSRLQSQIQLLWKTDEVRARSMIVEDEIDAGLSYFSLSLFAATTVLYRNLERALRDVYGDEANQLVVPSFMNFGSWIGGDRDGNPNVKPQTTVLALRLQARTILQEYVARLSQLRDQLSLSHGFCQPSEEFTSRLAQDRATLGAAVATLESTFLQEPYRHKLVLMKYRIEQILVDVEQRLAGFEPQTTRAHYSSSAFATDLKLMRESLRGHGDAEIAGMELQDLIRLAETFGFHLLQLDVRQESTRHTEAVAEIFRDALKIDYHALTEGERLAVLGDAIAVPGGLIFSADTVTESTRETLETFAVMAEMCNELGADCFSRYVISMTHAASHILEVMFLAAQSGLAGKVGGRWFCHIGVSPLFETITDLEHIEPVLMTLLDNPVYRALLDASQKRQEIMLGYSDSCKDGGILSSSWNLYRAQQKIIAITEQRSLKCRIFHGRGGTVGRGGGPTHESILAQPPDTVRGQIKFTEQGEMLFYRYNNMETAIYELTMGVTGLLKASVSLVSPVPRDKSEYVEVMSDLAHIGENGFRELTERTEGFLDYFYEATPVSEIGQLNIGSRPSHRKKQDRSKQSVRAIAWVFSWAQSRQTFPAWYGIGASIATWCAGKPERLQMLQAMYREWPFFRNLLSNVQMALSKSDIGIAKEYASLCMDPEVGKRIHGLIADEYHRCVGWILDVAGSEQLLAENQALANSLSRRNNFLGPLNIIQVVLLSRVRSDSENDAAISPWLQPLLRTINAIAAGMRNTG